MKLIVDDSMIPGTILKKKDMGDITGKEFLDKIFFISDGIMMAQIKSISGIDTSTLQNWVKRGWVGNSKLKRYNKNLVARILIINMLRPCMQLERIVFLMQYINGNLDDPEDDIISATELYDYICRIIDCLAAFEYLPEKQVRVYIDEVIADYEKKIGGAKRRLGKALEIIIVAHYAALLKNRSDEMLTGLIKPERK